MAIGVKVRKGSATNARARRHFRVRKKVSGTSARPRLVVSRSARHLFVQIVDDSTAKTLAYASTMEADLRNDKGDKTSKSRQVGVLIAKRGKEVGVSTVSARENGLEF
jgi:large subunit ribosomal protein L18